MDFQRDVIEKSNAIPVVVDFWAEWCGPCKFLTPILEELNSSNLTWELVKINVDDNPELARTYNIRSIPNVKMFVNGRVINEMVGAYSKDIVAKWINENANISSIS